MSSRHSIGRRAVAIAAAWCLLGGAVAALAAPPPAQAKPLLRVLAPHEEAIVQGRAVRVRVRLAPGASLRSARLNGVGVKRLLRRRGAHGGEEGGGGSGSAASRGPTTGA